MMIPKPASDDSSRFFLNNPPSFSIVQDFTRGGGPNTGHSQLPNPQQIIQGAHPTGSFNLNRGS